MPAQVEKFLVAGARQFGFMLRGLKELVPQMDKLNITFFLLRGNPVQTIPKLVKDTGAGLLVTDFAPMRIGREWREGVRVTSSLPMFRPLITSKRLLAFVKISDH